MTYVECLPSWPEKGNEKVAPVMTKTPWPFQILDRHSVPRKSQLLTGIGRSDEGGCADGGNFARDFENDFGFLKPYRNSACRKGSGKRK